MGLKKFSKLFIVMCVIMLLGGCGLFKTKIDLKNYINYSYDGIDGYTTLIFSIDTSGIENDFTEKISENKIESFKKLISSMKISASKAENLCNGDTIVLNVSYNEEYCEASGVKFAGNDMEISIEGLQEGEVLDLFADIIVNVKGIAPLAVATIENKSSNEFIKNLKFVLDKSTGFQAGDIITVTCEVDEKTAQDKGYVILEKSREYSTAGLEAYVDSSEKLDYNVLSEVVTEARAVVSSETEASQTRMLYKVTGSSNFLFQYNKEWIDSIELKEIRLLTGNAACNENGLPYNKLYIIFKAYVTNADHGSDGYFCFEYNNVLVDANGVMIINHDNQELRYLCDDNFEELMVNVMKDCQGIYQENSVDVSRIVLTDISIESEENETKDTEEESKISQN